MSKIPTALKSVNPRIARVGLLVTALVMVLGEIVTPVFAVNNYGPDGYDFSAWDRVYMVVSQGPGTSLDAPESIVYAYAPINGGGNKNITIRLQGADHCFDGRSVKGVDSSAPLRTSGSDTSFEFRSSAGVVTRDNSLRRVADSTNPVGCNTDTQDIAVPVTDADRPSVGSGLNGYYKIRVRAVMNNNGVNAFKVILPDGGIVSYTDASGNKFALQQRVDRDNLAFSNFYIKFATPCDAGPSISALLRWFDADQGQFGQSGSSYGYKLYERPRGSAGNNGWVEIAQNSDLGGDSEAREARYNFSRDKEYQWEWYGVSSDNGIQFQVPFDSAYSKVVCDGSDFSLTPTVSITPRTVGTGVENISVTAGVNKSGPTASFSDEEWRVTRFIVPPGSNLSGYYGQGREPCVQFSGYSKCDTPPGWSNTRQFTDAYTPLMNGWLDGVDSSLQPGTQICYVASVSKWASHSPTWGHSMFPACATVVQTPFAFILGNDLRVGSQFSTATSNVSSSVRGYVNSGGGSWVEYGLFAPNTVNGVASQSGARIGTTPDPSNPASWSGLTFANTGLSGCGTTQLGCFTNPDGLGKIPNVESVLTTGTVGVTRTRTTGSATTSGLGLCGTIGSSRIAIVTGTLTVDCDIRHSTAPVASAASINQLILSAGSIRIAPSVINIDAWVVSKGVLDTCDGVNRTSLRSNVCDQPLRINGPVMARTLDLKRTFYDQRRNRAAEELNLRGDAYIWANNVSRNNATWQTTYTTDLPPRY